MKMALMRKQIMEIMEKELSNAEHSPSDASEALITKLAPYLLMRTDE